MVGRNIESDCRSIVSSLDPTLEREKDLVNFWPNLQFSYFSMAHQQGHNIGQAWI